MLAPANGHKDACASGACQSRLDAIPVVIVGFRNAGDVAGCLRAHSNAHDEPRFEIFICENGGAEAYDALIAVLTAESGPCADLREKFALPTPQFKRQHLLELKPPGSGRRVHVGEAPENLGYAGGINAWLRQLMDVPGWSAVWILNPDTVPAADALCELATYSRLHGKGMVGSRIVSKTDPNRVQNRGLAWRRFRAATLAVDFFAPVDRECDSEDVEARLHSPCGASIYVTRGCIEAVGLMYEPYFLYFEDLEWGLRAKHAFGIGYAHQSIVEHAGGTTIGGSGGGSGRWRDQSPLSAYLQFRNRILFVRRNFFGWLPWTIVMQLGEALRFAVPWQPKKLRAAFRGIAAGVAGKTGRPDHMLRPHAQVGAAKLVSKVVTDGNLQVRQNKE